MEIAHIESLINTSQYTEANLHLRKLLDQDSNNIEYQQLLALSYSRSGALEKAKEFFEPIYRSHVQNQEVSGIMGGIYKRLFQKHQDVEYGKMAADIYEKNYSQTGSAYTGINAASMLLMTGKAMQAKEIARSIIDKSDTNSSDLWTIATLAEANLILKNYPDSKAYYIATRKAVKNNWGILNSIYKQLWLLNHYIRVPRDVIQLFNPPNVTVFAGHMLDHPDRKDPRFTIPMVSAVKEAIVAAIDTMDIQIGYSSLACGADILFAEAMLEHNKTLHVLLPFNREDFLDQSVRFAGSTWEDRFNSLLAKVEAQYITSERFMGKNESFEFLSQVMMGKGLLHAQRMDTKANMLTLLSAVSLESKGGGTRYQSAIWPANLENQNINIDKYFFPPSDRPEPTEKKQPQDFPLHSGISHILIIEAEDGFPIYQQKILEALETGLYPYYACRVEKTRIAILFKNIIGALDMANEINKMHKSSLSEYPNAMFPTILGHTGPTVFDEAIDEKIRKATGLELDLAFELMDMIPPNQITFTENFAACVALKNQKIKFEYAGVMESKLHGLVGVYHIQPDDLI